MGKAFYWLASYPKSGNTYLRILLCNYLSDLDTPVSINNLVLGDLINDRRSFEEYMGIPIEEIGQENVGLHRLGHCAYVGGQIDPPIITKVHNRYSAQPEKGAIFDKALSAGVVYLIRHPFDVLKSFSYHLDRSLEETLEIMIRADASLSSYLDSGQMPQHMGSWSEHVKSWVDQEDMPICLVRYENLAENPAVELGKVVNFIYGDVDAERVAKAVDFSTLDKLREQEEQEAFREKLPGAPSFFGRRLKNDLDLSDDVKKELIKHHGPMMNRLKFSFEKM